MKLVQIGVIHTPFSQASGAPLQPSMTRGAKGAVEVFEPFVVGLRDLEGFDRIWLLYCFHRASAPQIEIMPFLDSAARGLFATRAPCRPNPIGISSVGLIGIAGNTLQVEDVDMLDGSPLLDIKPFVPDFDCYGVKGCDCLSSILSNSQAHPSNGRFECKIS